MHYTYVCKGMTAVSFKRYAHSVIFYHRRQARGSGGRTSQALHRCISSRSWKRGQRTGHVVRRATPVCSLVDPERSRVDDLSKKSRSIVPFFDLMTTCYKFSISDHAICDPVSPVPLYVFLRAYMLFFQSYLHTPPKKRRQSPLWSHRHNLA